jgi:hypothetical protein
MKKRVSIVFLDQITDGAATSFMHDLKFTAIYEKADGADILDM